LVRPGVSAGKYAGGQSAVIQTIEVRPGSLSGRSSGGTAEAMPFVPFIRDDGHFFVPENIPQLPSSHQKTSDISLSLEEEE
jgi:hypothetical protein